MEAEPGSQHRPSAAWARAVTSSHGASALVTHRVMCMLLPGREEKTAVGALIPTRQATVFVGPPTVACPSTGKQAASLAAAAWTGSTGTHASTRTTLSRIRRAVLASRGNVTGGGPRHSKRGARALPMPAGPGWCPQHRSVACIEMGGPRWRWVAVSGACESQRRFVNRRYSAAACGPGVANASPILARARVLGLRSGCVPAAGRSCQRGRSSGAVPVAIDGAGQHRDDDEPAPAPARGSPDSSPTPAIPSTRSQPLSRRATRPPASPPRTRASPASSTASRPTAARPSASTASTSTLTRGPASGTRLGTWDAANVPNVGYVARLLNEYYPNTDEPAALTDLNQKAAAVQAAIWFFSDRYVLSTSDPLHNAVVGSWTTSSRGAAGRAATAQPHDHSVAC